MRQGIQAKMIRLVAIAALALLAASLADLGTPAARAGQHGDTQDQPVALTADQVEYDTVTGLVTASGNVEIYYGERTLTAERIVYDSTTGRITADGSIILRDSSGATVFADFADLDSELQDGLVRGARAVMGENIRLSATEARRVGARFNTLTKAVYSPCKVCADNPTPLWRIRAQRVIQDEVKKRIYYEDATFDVFGVPVAWLPYFSHPDPSVDRASGFLVPEFRHSSTYGYGIQVPYFWVIDDYSDMTFTPFMTTKGGLVGEVEYRRAFETGTFTTRGSLTYNDYQGRDELHGHVEAEGEFDLFNDIRWGFDGIAVTDRGYLRRYDFSDEDRLDSEFYIRRYRTDGFLDATAVYFQSLRDDEPSENIPVVLPQFDARREVSEDLLGGNMGIFSSGEVLFRQEGVDASRLSVGMDWERQEILPFGLSLRGFAEVRGDVFLSSNFAASDSSTEFRFAPLAGIEARFPLISNASNGVTHVLEPIAQAIVAPYGGNNDDISNEDSQVTEFDETNLFEISHFSGLDAVEEGPRLNLGFRYEFFAPGGFNFDATVGQVLRLQAADEFSQGSGLAGTASDWVGGWSARYSPYVTIRQRMRVDDSFSVTRNEIGAELTFGRFDVSADYIYLESDPEIEAPVDREEFFGKANVQVNRNWALSGFTRRNIATGKFVAVGGSIAYECECASVELFVKRDFTASDNAPASTSVGVQVRLFSLGNKNNSVR